MAYTRDRNLSSTFSGAHKLTLPVLEDSLTKHIKILGHSNAYTIAPFLPGGTLKLLAEFAARNSAAVGFLLYKVFHDIFASSNDNRYVDFTAMCEAFRKSTYTLTVSFAVGEVKELTAKFDSDTSTVIRKSGGSTTTVGTQTTGYGIDFQLKTVWKLKPADSSFPTYDFVWNDHVVQEPKKSCYQPLRVNPPVATEFDIGDVLSLLHASPKVSCEEMGIPEEGQTFPRRNTRVQAIEAALDQVKRLSDFHLAFLGSLFPAAASKATALVMPWSLSAWKPKEDAETLPDADNAFGAELATALREHHEEEDGHLVRNLGWAADLLQRLVLMRTYATQFLLCYEGVDHVMVHCFLQGIGAHNAELFTQFGSLDSLLMNIGKHQMTRAGIKTKAVGIRSPGCSIRLKVELPEQRGYFRPLEGIPCADLEHKGQLCFDGSTEDGIPTEGTSTRFVIMLPAESTMLVEKRPNIRVEGFTEFENVPVMLVIGTPEGAKTLVRAAFLFVDMWSMRQTLQVSFIPSNKAFKEATAALPPEMADFASAIRAMDVATSGFCIEIVELRGALADAIGVREDDLAGDTDWLRQLIYLMRGGASLQSLSQVTRKKRAALGDFVEVESATGPPAYDLAKIKAASQKLYDRMIAQGKVDHYEPPPPPPEPVHVSLSASPAPCFRSCGAADEYRSMCAVSAPSAPPAAAPPPPPAAVAPPAAATGNAVPSGVDAGVDALAGELAESLRTKDDGTNFMQRMLKALDSIPNPKAAVGAKIELTDPVTHCLFAKGKCADGVHTNDKKPPAEEDYKPRTDLDAATDSLVDLLGNCTKPIPTQRLTLFGVGCIWQTNMLEGLMSGDRDPSKVQLEIAQAIAPMLVA